MINGIFFIFAFQLAGTIIATISGLSVPGPVIGMSLLLAWLAVGWTVPESVNQLCDSLLRYLPLLFVPAAVGVIRYRDQILASGLSLLAIIIISTAVALISSVLVFSLVAAHFSPAQQDERRQK